MDYGHDLLFGSFLTPDASAPERVVGLGQLSDQVGLDLVTVQDHPYQARFLDAWTLLSTIAATTVNVRVALNVANLPLRPPAVLARSHAALDLLSGGRVELGLGGGAFWDAIEANGGPRRTPGETVASVEEAVRIVRALWDEGATGAVQERGDVYDVHGAHRGPAPAHDMSIWVGAVGPRMQRLVGRLADGWLPSMMYLGPEKLPEAHARIDEAALAAGRAPSDVRRLYNVAGRFTSGSGRGLLQGPATVWAEQLADLALGQGISAFIMAGDDPDVIRRFAQEVAPAVREQVEAERLTGGATTKEDPAAVAEADGSRGVEDARGTVSVRGGFTVTPTPDDGTRRSVVQVWDESTRPTAPAAPEGHEYTAHENATGQQLVDIHDHLRAELAQVEELIGQVEAGAISVGAARSHISTMTMRQNSWTLGTYCESYCRLVTTHHTIEDRSMFPSLRRFEPRLGPVVDRLEEEHVAIHDVLEAVDQALVAMVGEEDQAAGLAGLRAAVDLLSDTLLSHLSYEERELVEPLARLGVV
ncbi:LLM class flavin-dependent oxidoreductase [Cellulomonas sp. PhB143]|uniref:LLM class flavin-dependent oxidoreductase n=1 Tax=Cellulomonas sp. PhB143 TaxID=2485186 RepID=UPI000F4A2332|nr:LLM class flavin-dependent oxidoreductase [Cellulomonas sp. PhB143]ROS75268.1 hemerythrin HHE cation binding domain-containing protein [Cellulomonas sp. PhB143]